MIRFNQSIALMRLLFCNVLLFHHSLQNDNILKIPSHNSIDNERQYNEKVIIALF